MKAVINDEMRNVIREYYRKVAEKGAGGSGWGPSSCAYTPHHTAKEIALYLGYSQKELDAVPDGSNMGLGCGNPQIVAEIKPGETILDLGCGGGFDCFLAAREVGENGQVIGVDMEPAMITKARRLAETMPNYRIEFRLGEIENLPVADGIVDAIISNCVIYMSPEKGRAFQEMYRVLKPGGRLAMADLIAALDLSDQEKKGLNLCSGGGCGVLSRSEIKAVLNAAGFMDIQITEIEKCQTLKPHWNSEYNLEDYVVPATVMARKPLKNASPI